MPDKPLKIAVIGAGGIARGAHLPALARMDNVEIAAVCDIVPEKARQAAEQYGIPVVFESFEDALALPGLDAVDLCLPNCLHAPFAIAAMERGLHVFCEKPDALNAAEAERMKAASEANGRVLMVMRNNRYMPVSKYLKQFIDEGRMGEIYAARCGWQRRRGIPGRGGWFTTKAMSGGGPLIDLGVHMIDLTLWLMGNPTPVAVSCCTYRKFADRDVAEQNPFRSVDPNGVFDVEDLAMGFIRFDNGACMQVEFSWASNIEREKRFFELRGAKAGAEWNSLTEKLAIFGEDHGCVTDLFPSIDNTAGIRGHEANLRHFADVVLNGVPPAFVPQQGVNMVKILEAMYRSAESGREIIL